MSIALETVARLFLTAWQSWQQAPYNATLSPRELQMMVLTWSALKPNSTQAIAIALNVIQKTISSILKPHQHATFWSSFQAQVQQPLTPKILHSSVPQQINQFAITPSREPIYEQAQLFLAVRELRVKKRFPAHTYPGLGGFLLEGSPGIGKTAFVEALLTHHGFQFLPWNELSAERNACHYS